MALSSLASHIHNLWVVNGRRGNDPAGTPVGTSYAALVSDLVTGDFILGARAEVVGTPTVSGTNHVVTLSRRGSLNFTVTWPSSATVWIVR